MIWAMQLPKRKPPQFSEFEQDPLITQEKFLELQNRLKKLLASRPRIADEVHRLAQNGDFSENAEYQQAKGRLRGMNDEITRLEFQLNRAQIIETASASRVAIGHTVTVTCDGTVRTYTILGSSETNPAAGIISHNSPIGAALLGHYVGDTFKVLLAEKEREFVILEIN